MEDNMRYVVDEIVDNKVKLESLSDKSIIIEDKSLFPNNIYEGAVVFKKDNYIIDYEYEKNRRELINDKLNRLKELD